MSSSGNDVTSKDANSSANINNTTDDRWVEFSSSLCRQLNAERTCTLVCDELTAERLLPMISPVVATHPLSSSLAKILFSTEENRKKFSSCLAVHGHEPLFAVTDCDNDSSYVLKLASPGSEKSSEEVRSFLDRVATGAEPAAKKGSAPLPDDVFDDAFDIDLVFVKCAVQSTFSRLTGREGRAVVDYRSIAILFSDRCPCCPPLLRTMDYLFSLVEEKAGQDEVTQNTTVRVLCACNVDDNELDAEDWPTDESEQVVPMLNGYVNGKLTRFLGPKTGASLIDFVCRTFFGPAESAIQSMAEFLRSQVTLDTQGRIAIPEKAGSGGATSGGLGGKSKRTRSGRQLDSSDLELALGGQ